MLRVQKPWPLTTATCCGIPTFEAQCVIAFTIIRERDLPQEAMSFDQMYDGSTKCLFHLFLELARILNESEICTCFLETVLDPTMNDAVCYTFFLATTFEKEDSCEKIMAHILKRVTLTSLNNPRFKYQAHQSYSKFTRISKLKDALTDHQLFSKVTPGETSGTWSGVGIDAHLAFAASLAFVHRNRTVCDCQSAWNMSSYFENGKLNFPKPDYVYMLNHEDLGSPEETYARLLPDVQARFSSPSAAFIVDYILAMHEEIGSGENPLDQVPAGTEFGEEDDERERIRDVVQTYMQEVARPIDMANVQYRQKTHSDYTKTFTFETLRKKSEERLKKIDDVACNAGQWRDLRTPITAARKLYLGHVDLTFQIYSRQFRGAFYNISPCCRKLMEYAEENMLRGQPVPVSYRKYSDLDPFCDRMIRRNDDFRDIFLIADHNVRWMTVLSLFRLDSYSYSAKWRVALNVLFHSLPGGTGKSELLRVLSEISAPDSVLDLKYMTPKARAVEDYEQCDNIFVFDDLKQDLVDKRDKAGGNDEERLQKEALSHPEFKILSYFFDEDEKKRVAKLYSSLWISTFFSACNIPGLLCYIISDAMLDRHLLVHFDESTEAMKEISAKKFTTKKRIGSKIHEKARHERCDSLRAEQIMTNELQKLLRIKGLQPPSVSVTSIILQWLFHKLEDAGYNVRTRAQDRIEALTEIVCYVDVISRLYFDEGSPYEGKEYDLEGMKQADSILFTTVQHTIYSTMLVPEFFLDPLERDIRRALATVWSNQDRSVAMYGYRLEPTKKVSGENKSTLVVDHNYLKLSTPTGLKGLASILRGALEHTKDRRLLPSADAIQFRLKTWLSTKYSIHEWKSLEDEAWPVEDKSTPKTLRYVAYMHNTGERVNYYILTAWITHIPEKPENILLAQFKELCKFRHQGGFSVPCGEDPDYPGNVRVVKFPKADDDAPTFKIPSEDSDKAYEVEDYDLALDEWGATRRNELLYISRNPVVKLGEVQGEKKRDPLLRNCSFVGKPLSDLLRLTKIDKESITRTLMEEPEDGRDYDADETSYVIRSTLTDAEYPWTNWEVECGPGEESPPFMRFPHEGRNVATMEMDQVAFRHNRSNYKLIAGVPKNENERRAAQMREKGRVIGVERWIRSERTSAGKRDRIWKEIENDDMVRNKHTLF